MARHIRARIDCAALKHNYCLAKNAAPDSKTLAVVKADAYGHGIDGVVSALDDLVPAYAVATIDEGLYLRGLTDKPILVLEGILRPDELVEATHYRLTLMLHHVSQLALLRETRLHQPINIWLKQDSGMHRLGLSDQEILSAVSQLRDIEYVSDDMVIAGHYANASEPGHELNLKQQSRLLALKSQLPESIQYSLANSAAILADSDSHLDWNRPGIMLYGGAPFDDPDHSLAKALKPVMRLESEVLAIRDIAAGESVGYGSTWTASRPSKIATVGIGYADGYPRHLPSGTPVAIRQQLAPLAGRVSMDMIGVDVTELPDVTISDPVELWGPTVSVNHIAEAAGTISYELMTKVTPRVPRDYVD